MFHHDWIVWKTLHEEVDEPDVDEVVPDVEELDQEVTVVAGEEVVDVVLVVPEEDVPVVLDELVLELEDIHHASVRELRSGKKILRSGKWVKLDMISSICL